MKNLKKNLWHMSKFFLYLVTIQSLFITITTANESFSQKLNDVYISYEWKKARLEKVFQSIQYQTEYHFTYDRTLVRDIKVSGKKENEPLLQLLYYLSDEIGLHFTVQGQNILVHQGSSTLGEKKNLDIPKTLDLLPLVPSTIIHSIEELNMMEVKIISGIVRSSEGEPLIGASIVIKGSSQGTVSDIDGSFSLTLPENEERVTIVVSYLGYETLEIEVTKEEQLIITMLEDATQIDEVVVTGFSNPRSRLESSVAISTLDSKVLEAEAAQSAANLMKFIPGFVLETSGGVAGNNLFARGIPSGGAFVYVQVQEDGLPLFEDGALQFANVDNWLRTDETINRVEAVRGGSGSIFATNSPGGIINFISKTGTNTSEGVVKFTTGDFGLFRTDANISGPLVKDKLFYSMGGFYRVDQGVRSPGFTANDGGQFKANLRYQLDNGYVKLSYKKLDDQNIFYLPIPLQGEDGDPAGIDGFDPNYGTLTSENFRRLSVPEVGGGTFDRDLEEGIHPVVDAIGAEFKFDINEHFSLKSSLKNTRIDLTYNAIFTYSPPTTAQAFAEGRSIINPIYEYAETGQVAAPSLVAEVGFWGIDKQLQNFANNFQFAYNKDALSLTFGHYYSNYKANQQWNWSNLFIEATDEPQLLNLSDGDLQPTDTNYSRTLNGVSRISWLNRDTEIQGVINAIYFNGEVELNDKLTIDVGLRYDIDRYSGYRAFADTDNRQSLGIAETSADDDILAVGAPLTYWEYDLDRLSYSVGANYKVTDQWALFGRVSEGFRSPTESSYFSRASDPSNLRETVVQQYEVGAKMRIKHLTAFATLFYMDMKNVEYNRLFADGTQRSDFSGAENLGFEVEAQLDYKSYGLSLKGTFQNPELTDYQESPSGDLSGNNVRRIPKTYFNLRPSIDVLKNLNLFMNWGYYGSKFVNNENTIELPSYSEIDFGAVYSLNSLTLSANLKNAFNTIGLTEGNPRENTLTKGDIFYARPILGRHFTVSVSYRF